MNSSVISWFIVDSNTEDKAELNTWTSSIRYCNFEKLCTQSFFIIAAAQFVAGAMCFLSVYGLFTSKCSVVCGLLKS